MQLSRNAKCERSRKGKRLWGYSSAGRAPALQAGGHRFDPDYLHQRRAEEVGLLQMDVGKITDERKS